MLVKISWSIGSIKGLPDIPAPTNTTLGCINYWLTQEAKNELGKDTEMKMTVSSAVFSFANVPAH